MTTWNEMTLTLNIEFRVKRNLIYIDYKKMEYLKQITIIYVYIKLIRKVKNSIFENTYL